MEAAVKAHSAHTLATQFDLQTRLFNNLPDAALSSPAPAKMPVNDDTLGGMLAFIMHHEAYHIGQLSLLRRILGKEAMKYG